MARSINVLKSTAVVGAFTMLSRVLGLLREMLQSRCIGADVEQSAFALAFALPNLARKLFGEGALTAAFVPVFKSEVERDSVAAAAKLARAVMTMVMLMLGAIVLLSYGGLEVAVHQVERIVADGPDQAVHMYRLTLTARLVRTLLPYMIFICGAAFGMGVLNAMGRFKASSFMPCLLNLVWIGVLAALSFFPGMPCERRVWWVSVAILAAGAAQMAFMMWRMSRAGVSPLPRFRGWRDSKVVLVWKNTGIAALGAGAVQLNYMLDTFLAQYASGWAAGVIGYAERLMDLPLGVVGAAFGTVLLPAYAERFGKNDFDGARSVFGSSTRNMMFVMVPAAVGLGVLAPECVSVIYRGGAFDAAAVTRVARAVACYACGLAFFGLNKSLVPWFQAQNDMKTPLRVSVSMVFLNAVLNVLAVLKLPVEWRHVGLAASTVFCSGVSVAVLAVVARRRNGRMGWRRLAPDFAKIAFASAVMGAALLALKRALPFSARPVLTLAVEMAAGGAVYFAVVFALLPDMRNPLRTLRRRRKGASS